MIAMQETFITAGPNGKSSEGKPAVAPMPETIGAIDLCSGLGGISWAAKNLGFQILGGVDTNDDALRTFAKNFPGAKTVKGSILSKKIISECEKMAEPYRIAGLPFVVLSGPPCQGFSVAGSRKAGDSRNRVLGGVARAIAKLQPDFALVENVSMILDARYKNRIAKFTEVLQRAGYNVLPVVLNASEYGVSQRRKRVFFLITRAQLNELDVEKMLAKLKIPGVGAKDRLAGLPQPKIRPDDYNDEANYGTVHNHFAMQHSERVKEKITKIAPGTGPMSYRRLHPERLSNTLFSGHRAPPAHFAEGRSITVREAARLQGFPDDFRIYGSFGKQMEQVTNAVPPPLAQAVLEVLFGFAGLPIHSYA